MKKNIILLFLLAGNCMVVLADTQKSDVEFGRVEYERNCASCHGINGEGNGEKAESLDTPPSNLTILSKNNNGFFPFTEIYQTIEGSPRVGVHGSREMPIWGDRYRAEAKINNENERVYTRGLILDLIIYLHSIQK